MSHARSRGRWGGSSSASRTNSLLGNLDAQHPRYYRPTEVDQLKGDASKARDKLGWEPRTSVEDMARRMVDHDMELARQEKTLRDAGHKLPATVGHDQ